MKKEKQASRQESKAHIFFGIYYTLGPGRSLTKLSDRVAEVGLKTSLKTLKRYSANFNWQQRVIELDTELKKQTDQQAIVYVQGMNTRQAQFGLAMQVLGAAQLKRVHDAKEELTVKDITALGREGVKIERLAMGEATERHEILAQVCHSIVQQIVALFVRVNEMPDPEARKREFAAGGDKIVGLMLAEAP